MVSIPLFYNYVHMLNLIGLFCYQSPVSMTNISIYNKLIETPIDKRLINADSLNNVIQRQEVELVKESKDYGDYTHNITINWKDVQKGLGENDIAIE